MGIAAHHTPHIRRHLAKWRGLHAELDYGNTGAVFQAYLELVGLAAYLEDLLDTDTEAAA